MPNGKKREAVGKIKVKFSGKLCMKNQKITNLESLPAFGGKLEENHRFFSMMVACAERFRRRFVEAILAGSTPVRYPEPHSFSWQFLLLSYKI